MKRLVVVGLALVVSEPARADPAGEGFANLTTAIRAKDANAVAKRLSDRVTVAGMYFADATCAKRFSGKQVTGKDLAALAKCLAPLKLQPTTRRSGTPYGAILTLDPGIELEVVFDGARVRWIGYPTGIATPTLTAQTFEALRTAGTTNVDAAVRRGFELLRAPSAAAWIAVCLDKAGAVTSTNSVWMSAPGVGDVFRGAIKDWKFRPFVQRTTAMAACSLSRLSYPAATAPAVEELPINLGAMGVDDVEGEVNGEEEGVEGGIEGGVVGGVVGAPPPPPPPPPPAPSVVPPQLLEGTRIKGVKEIVPDDLTKVDIANSGKDKIVGSYKLCVAVSGTVSTVAMLKSTGFPAYDAKIRRELLKWAYRPYQVNGRAVPVCTAVTFIYSQPAAPPPKKK